MGFVNRKKSGNIIGGSRLVVDGQNIFNVQEKLFELHGLVGKKYI